MLKKFLIVGLNTDGNCFIQIVISIREILIKEIKNELKLESPLIIKKNEIENKFILNNKTSKKSVNEKDKKKVAQLVVE
jgi:hypothetical protein